MKKTGIAAALLLAVMLTGCGGNSSGTGDAVSSAETTTSAAETTTSAADTTTSAAETTASAAETTTAAAAETTGAAAEETTKASSDTTAASEANTEAAGQQAGQNPMMNYIGKYRSDRALIRVECTGAKGAKFTVTWAGSAAESGVWTMSGESEETDAAIVVKYTDCYHNNIEFDENGTVVKDEKVYENGTGTMTFDKTTNKLTWKDDKEDIAKDMEFTFSAE